jgi:hypothetical protein
VLELATELVFRSGRFYLSRVLGVTRIQGKDVLSLQLFQAWAGP